MSALLEPEHKEFSLDLELKILMANATNRLELKLTGLMDFVKLY